MNLRDKTNDLFEKLRWPSVEEEEWRRTDLTRLLPKGLLNQSAEMSGAAAASKDVSPPPAPSSNGSGYDNSEYAARIVTRRGQVSSIDISPEAAKTGLTVEWIAAESLPPSVERQGQSLLEENPGRITAWHWRDSPGTLYLRQSQNTSLKKPLIIEEMAEMDEHPILPHIHVEAESNSELHVVWAAAEQDGSKEPSSYSRIVNAGLTASCGANALLGLYLRQKLDSKTIFFLNGSIDVDRDGRLIFAESHMGGALVKTRTDVSLNAPGADAQMKGVFTAGNSQHLDIGTVQRHKAPNTTSDALYKGVVFPGGRSVFQGLIDVSTKAAKTDAYLTNKNLVLGKSARVDSLPQLNILTDDVRCSHGSTTGKLNASQLFYLMSRGFSRKEAEQELARGFLMAVYQDVPAAVANILSSDLKTIFPESSNYGTLG